MEELWEEKKKKRPAWSITLMEEVRWSPSPEPNDVSMEHESVTAELAEQG